MRENHSVTVFIFTTAIFFITGFLILAGVKFSIKATLFILGSNCLSALVFLYCYWNLPGFMRRHWGLLKSLIAPVAIGVATLSKIYSDSAIAEFSGLSPQDLPGTQLLLTLILTPVIWILALSLAFGYASLLLIPFLFVRKMIHEHHKKNSSKRKRNYAGPSHLTAIIAVSLSAIYLLTMIEKVASKSFYEPRLRQAIAFASFHLPATYCGLVNSEGVAVAPLSDDRAAIAIPDGKLGYRFELITCKPARKSVEDVRVILDELAAKLKADATLSSLGAAN